MKNSKIKIILSAIIFLSVAGFAGIVFAAGSSLYVSPASLTKTVGDTLSVSVGVNAAGSKVCAVEGTLVFNNLSCQSISVADDVNPQSSPTCSKSYFLIGVPSCTTVDKVLFAVSVKTGSAGTASISFTGVDIIGEGVSLSKVSNAGNYTINTKVVPAPILKPVKTPAVTKSATSTTTEATTTQVAPIVSPESQVAAAAGTSGSAWPWIFAGAAILIVLIGGLYRSLILKK